jgi:hypothetical protein
MKSLFLPAQRAAIGVDEKFRDKGVIDLGVQMIPVIPNVEPFDDRVRLP